MSHKNDWVEALHRFLYRGLRGRVYENQYVGTFYMDEEQFEQSVLHPNDVKRNLPAYWKYHVPSGRDSEGSWRITNDTHPEYVEPGMQLHFTLFVNDENSAYVDVYAHLEPSWSSRPVDHLLERGFSAHKGVIIARSFFDKETYAVLHVDK